MPATETDLTLAKKALADELVAEMDTFNIPDYMWDPLLRYLVGHKPVGSFLTAVLQNDLWRACLAADDTNILHLRDYVRFLANFAPPGSWGTSEAVSAWLNRE